MNNLIAKILRIRELVTEWKVILLTVIIFLEVYTKVAALAKSVRKNPRPVLLEFKTFRIRGHEEASGTKYVPQDVLDFWTAKDPIENYQEYL